MTKKLSLMICLIMIIAALVSLVVLSDVYDGVEIEGLPEGVHGYDIEGNDWYGEQFEVTKKYFVASMTFPLLEKQGNTSDNGCIGLTIGYENYECFYVSHDIKYEDGTRGIGFPDDPRPQLRVGMWWPDNGSAFGQRETIYLDGKEDALEGGSYVGGDITISVECHIDVDYSDNSWAVTIDAAYVNGTRIALNGGLDSVTAYDFDCNPYVGYACRLTGTKAQIRFAQSMKPIKASVLTEGGMPDDSGMTDLAGNIISNSIGKGDDDEKPELEIKMHALSLSDTINLKYAVKSDRDNVELVVKFNDKEYIISEKYTEKIGGEEYYIFDFEKIASKNMADYVYAKARVKVGGKDYYSEVDKYSVLQYAYTVLGKTGGTASKDETLKELIVAALNYGGLAQKYLGYKSDHLASDDWYYIKIEGGTLEDGFNYGLYLEDDEITITLDEGTSFSHWVDGNGNELSTNGKFTTKVGDLIGNDDEKTNIIISAEKKPSEGLEFTSNGDGTCYVSGIGTCTDTDILIPQTSPTGDKVTGIGDRAFYCFTSLTKVTIPNSVTSIGGSAFASCTRLTSVTIPDSVTSIGDSAFWWCTSLTSITIGNGVTSIGDFAFWHCTRLESITVASGNSVYHSAGNCLIETASKTLILGCKNSIIPADGSVTSIGEFAFWECTNLKSITIPDSVTSIDEGAFWECTGLESITIPDSVTSIGEIAFSDCTSLKSAVIGKGVTSIDYMAFYGCTSLNKVYYKGTADEWSKITIGSSNSPLTSATRYYFSETQPTEEGNWWHYVNGIPTVWEIDDVVPDSQTYGGFWGYDKDTGHYTCYWNDAPSFAVLPIGDGVVGDGVSRYSLEVTTAEWGQQPEWGIIYGGKDVDGDGWLIEGFDRYWLALCNGANIVHARTRDTFDKWDELDKEHLAEITEGEEVTMKIIVDITEKTVEFYLNDILIDTRNEETGELDFTEFGNMIGVCSKVIGAEFWDLKYTPLDPIEPTDPTDPSNPSDTPEIKTINAKGGAAGENKTGDVATVTKKYFAVSYTMTAASLAGDPMDNGMCGLMFGGDDSTCVAIPYDGGTTDTQRKIGIWGGPYLVFGNWWGSPCIFNGTAAAEITPDTEVTILILGVKNDDGTTTVSAYLNGEQINVWGKSLTATGDFNGQIGWITKLAGQEATVKFTESDDPISATVFGGEDNETDDEPTTANNFYYTVNDDGTSCTITGFIGITPTEATIPATINGYKVTTIGEWAFSDCTSLTSITIPYSVTSIGYWAFGGCSSLKKVNYTGGVESWLKISFSGFSSNPCCNGAELYFNGTLVTEVTVPDTFTKINSYAFYYCTSLTNITIPDSVTSIGDDAFYYCTSLTNITIPDSVTYIRSFTFYNCSSLKNVYYGGSAVEWSSISISSYNTKLTNATRYYYSETEPTTSGRYWHYVDGVVTEW